MYGSAASGQTTNQGVLKLYINYSPMIVLRFSPMRCLRGLKIRRIYRTNKKHIFIQFLHARARFMPLFHLTPNLHTERTSFLIYVSAYNRFDNSVKIGKIPFENPRSNYDFRIFGKQLLPRRTREGKKRHTFIWESLFHSTWIQFMVRLL